MEQVKSEVIYLQQTQHQSSSYLQSTQLHMPDVSVFCLASWSDHGKIHQVLLASFRLPSPLPAKSNNILSMQRPVRAHHRNTKEKQSLKTNQNKLNIRLRLGQ